MPFATRSIHWSSLAALVASIALVGCGGEAPSAAPMVSQPNPGDVSVTPVDSAVTPTGATTEQPVASAAPEPAATRDRATLDTAAAQVHHDVDRTTGGVTRAVGDAPAQARQAADEAVDGVKDFATGLRDDAKQSLDEAANQIKSSARGAASDAQKQVQGKINFARNKARNQARAVGATIEKQVEGAEDRVLNGVLGPAAAPSNP